MRQISISDIQRNLHKLKDFDIVEVIDKKRDKVKGYFVDKKYALAIQALIKQQREEGEVIASKIAGSLRSYANPSLHEAEKIAWKKHVEDRYPQ